MNRLSTLVAITLTLSLFTYNAVATPVTPSEEPLKAAPSTQEMVKQAKELGRAAWEKTRQNSAQVSRTIQKKSKEYYEAAKASASETADAVAEKSKSYYKATKERSDEYLEKASEAAAELTETVKEKASEYYKSGKETLKPTGERPNHTI